MQQESAISYSKDTLEKCISVTATSHETVQTITSRSAISPTTNPTSQLERSAANRLRTTMAA